MKHVVLIVSVVLSAAVFATPASASGDSAGKGAAGNVVTRWVEHALDAVRIQNVATPDAGRLRNIGNETAATKLRPVGGGSDNTPAHTATSRWRHG